MSAYYFRDNHLLLETTSGKVKHENIFASRRNARGNDVTMARRAGNAAALGDAEFATFPRSGRRKCRRKVFEFGKMGGMRKMLTPCGFDKGFYRFTIQIIFT